MARLRGLLLAAAALAAAAGDDAATAAQEHAGALGLPDDPTRFASADLKALAAEAHKRGAEAATDGAKWHYWGWERDLQNLMNDANQIQGQVNDISSATQSKWNTRNDFNNKAASEEGRAPALEQQAKTMRSTMESEKKQKEDASADVEKYTTELNAANEVKDATGKDLTTISADLAAARTAFDAAKATHDDLARRAADLKASVDREEKAASKGNEAVEKAVASKRAMLTTLTRLVETEDAAASSAAKAAKDVIASARGRRDRAKADETKAETDQATAETTHHKLDAEVKTTVAKIADARMNADKVARETVEKAKAARQAAIDAEEEAKKAAFEAETAVKVAKAGAEKAAKDLEALKTSEATEAAELEKVTATVKAESEAQKTKLAAEEAQRAAAVTALRAALHDAKAAYENAVARNKIAAASHTAEIARLTTRLHEAEAAMYAAGNKTAAGLKALRVDREALEKALDAAKKAQEKTAADLAGQASKLLNQTHTAQNAIAAIQAARTAAEAQWEIAQGRRAAKQKEAEAAVAMATERRQAMEKTLALERGERDKEITAARNAEQDAENLRTRTRREAERNFISQSSDVRTAEAAAQHDVEQLMAQRDGAKVEAEAAAGDLKTRRGELDAVERERAGIVKELTSLREKKAHLEAAVMEHTAHTAAAKRETHTKEEALADALTTVASRRTEFEAVDKRRVDVQAEVDRATARMKDAATANAAVGADMARMKGLQQTIIATADAITAANRRLDAADATKAHLQHAIADLTARKEAAEASVAELTTRLDARKATASVAQGTNEELAKKAAALTKEARTVESASEAKVKALEGEVAALKASGGKDLAKLAADLKAAEAARSALAMQLAGETAQLVAKARADAQKLRDQAAKAIADKKKRIADKAASAKPGDAADPAALLTARLRELTGAVQQLEAAAVAKPQHNRRRGGAAAAGGAHAGAAPVDPRIHAVSGGAATRAIVGEPVPVGPAIGVRSAHTDVGLDRPIVAPGAAGVEAGPVYGLVPGEVAVPVDAARLRGALASSSHHGQHASHHAPASPVTPAEVRREMREAGLNPDAARDVIGVHSRTTGERVFVTSGKRKVAPAKH